MSEKVAQQQSDHFPLDKKKSEPTTTPSVTASQESLALTDGGYGSSDEHIFKDPAAAEYWVGVYEKARYENRHRFDPTFTWTTEEEKKLVRKIDLRIMLWAWIMFCSLDLHRRNINRAISDNMLPELGTSLSPTCGDWCT